MPTAAIAYYFNTIVLGENASVAVGDVDIASQVNTIRVGDFDSLRHALIRNGVPESDIEVLRKLTDGLTAEDVSQNRDTASKLRDWSADTARKIEDTGWRCPGNNRRNAAPVDSCVLR